jgi:hypothetical protein
VSNGLFSQKCLKRAGGPCLSIWRFVLISCLKGLVGPVPGCLSIYKEIGFDIQLPHHSRFHNVSFF